MFPQHALFWHLSVKERDAHGIFKTKRINFSLSSCLKIFPEHRISFYFSETETALMERCFSGPLLDPDRRMSLRFRGIAISDKYHEKKSRAFARITYQKSPRVVSQIIAHRSPSGSFFCSCVDEVCECVCWCVSMPGEVRYGTWPCCLSLLDLSTCSQQVKGQTFLFVE